jgi:SAM-dependent methyltransferase
MKYREIIYRQYAAKFQSSGYQRADIASRWAKVYCWYLRNWLPTNSSARILDVGCGGGQMLSALKILSYKNCVGVDVSPQQIDRARLSGLDVECCNCLDYLRRHEAVWDTIFAIDVLEHLAKDEAVDFITAAHAALKPGGRLILQMPNPSAPAGMRVYYSDFTHEVSISPDCAGRLLDLFGFEQIESRETGPIPGWMSPLGTARFAVWQLCRIAMAGFDFIETGGFGNRIFTRVYLISALRKAARPAP